MRHKREDFERGGRLQSTARASQSGGSIPGQSDRSRLDQFNTATPGQRDRARLDQLNTAIVGQSDRARLDQFTTATVGQNDRSRLDQFNTATVGQNDRSRLDQFNTSTVGRRDRSSYDQVDHTRCDQVDCTRGQFYQWCDQVDRARCDQVDRARSDHVDRARSERGRAVPRPESHSSERQILGKQHGSNHSSYPAGYTTAAERQSRRSYFDECRETPARPGGEGCTSHSPRSRSTQPAAATPAWPPHTHPTHVQADSIGANVGQSRHSGYSATGESSVNCVNSKDNFNRHDLYENYHQSRGKHEAGNFQSRAVPFESFRRSVSQGWLPETELNQTKHYSENARLSLEQSGFERRGFARQDTIPGLTSCTSGLSNTHTLASIPVIGNQIRSLRFDTVELQYMTEPNTQQVTSTIPSCSGYLGPNGGYIESDSYNTHYPNYVHPFASSYSPCDLRFVPSAAQQFDSESFWGTSAGSGHGGHEPDPGLQNRQMVQGNASQVCGSIQGVADRHSQHTSYRAEQGFGTNTGGHAYTTDFNSAVCPETRPSYPAPPSHRVEIDSLSISTRCDGVDNDLAGYNRGTSVSYRHDDVAEERRQAGVSKPCIQRAESTIQRGGHSQAAESTIHPRGDGQGALPPVPPPPPPPHILLKSHIDNQQTHIETLDKTQTSQSYQWSQIHQSSERIPGNKWKSSAGHDGDKYLNTSNKQPSRNSALGYGNIRSISSNKVTEPNSTGSIHLSTMRTTKTRKRHHSGKCLPNLLHRRKRHDGQTLPFRPWQDSSSHQTRNRQRNNLTVYSTNLLTRHNSNDDAKYEQDLHCDLVKDAECDKSSRNISTETSCQGLNSVVAVGEADSSTADKDTPSKLGTEKTNTVNKPTSQDDRSKYSEEGMEENKNNGFNLEETNKNGLKDKKKLKCADDKTLTGKQNDRDGGNKGNTQINRSLEECLKARQETNHGVHTKGAKHTHAKSKSHTDTMQKSPARIKTIRSVKVKRSLPLSKVLPQFKKEQKGFKSKKMTIGKKDVTRHFGKSKGAFTKNVNTKSAQDIIHYRTRSVNDQKQEVCLSPTDKRDSRLKGNATTADKFITKVKALEAKHQHMLSHRSKCLQPDTDTRLSSVSKVTRPDINISSSLPDSARPDLPLKTNARHKNLKKLAVVTRKGSSSVDSLQDKARPAAAAAVTCADETPGTAGLDKNMDNRYNSKQCQPEQQHFYKLGRNMDKNHSQVAKTSANIKTTYHSKSGSSNHMKHDHIGEKSSGKNVPNTTESRSSKVSKASSPVNEKQTVILPLKMRHKMDNMSKTGHLESQTNGRVRTENAVLANKQKQERYDRGRERLPTFSGEDNTNKANSRKTHKKLNKSQIGEKRASDGNVETNTNSRRKEIHKRMCRSLSRGKYKLSSPTTYIVKQVKPSDAAKPCASDDNDNDKRFHQACATAKQLLQSRKNAPKAQKNITPKASIPMEDLNAVENMSQHDTELGSKAEIGKGIDCSEKVPEKIASNRKECYTSQDDHNSDMIIPADKVKTNAQMHNIGDLNSNFSQFYSSVLEQNFGISQTVSQKLCEKSDSFEMYRQYLNAKIDLSHTDRQPIENVYPPLLVSTARMPSTHDDTCVSSSVPCLYDQGGLMSATMSSTVQYCYQDVVLNEHTGVLLSCSNATGEQDPGMLPDSSCPMFSPNIGRAEACDRQEADLGIDNDLPVKLSAVPLENMYAHGSDVFENDLTIDLNNVDLATACTNKNRTEYVDLDQYANELVHCRNVFDDALTEFMDDSTFSFKSDNIVEQTVEPSRFASSNLSDTAQTTPQAEAGRSTSESRPRDSSVPLTAYQVRIRSERRKRYQKHFPYPLPKAKSDKAASAERGLYKDAKEFLANFDASKRRSSQKSKGKAGTSEVSSCDNAAVGQVKPVAADSATSDKLDVGQTANTTDKVMVESTGKRINDQEDNNVCKKQNIPETNTATTQTQLVAQPPGSVLVENKNTNKRHLQKELTGKTVNHETSDSQENQRRPIVKLKIEGNIDHKSHSYGEKIPLLRIKNEKSGLKIVKSEQSKVKCRENRSGHFNAVTKRLKQREMEVKATQAKSRSTSTCTTTLKQAELSNGSRNVGVPDSGQPVSAGDEVRGWKCVACGAVFEREAQMRNHCRSVHKEWCWKCNIKLPSSMERRVHVKRGHSTKMYCCLCAVWCCNKYVYNAHLACQTHQMKEATKQARLAIDNTPGETPDKTQGKTPAKTSAKALDKTPRKTPGKTPDKIQGKTIGKTPDKTLVKTSTTTLGKTTSKTISKTTGKTPCKTPGKKSYPTPVKSNQHRDVNNNHNQASKAVGASQTAVASGEVEIKEELDGKVTMKKEKAAQYCTTCEHFYKKFASHLKTNIHKIKYKEIHKGNSQAPTQTSSATVDSNIANPYPAVKLMDPQPSTEVNLPSVGCNPVLLIKNVASHKSESPCSPQSELPCSPGYDAQYKYKQHSGAPSDADDVCVLEMLDATPTKQSHTADSAKQADREICVLTTLPPGSNKTKPRSDMTKPGSDATKPGSDTTKPGPSMTNLDILKGIKADRYYRDMVESKARLADDRDEDYTECVLKQDPIILVSSDSELM